jgi:predicted nucleotidyltransferase
VVSGEKALEPQVRSAVSEYLAAVDARLPRVVGGLYLIGSVALGDFRPHESDVDFVAVTRDRLSAEDDPDGTQAEAGLRWDIAHRLPTEVTGMNPDSFLVCPVRFRSRSTARPAVGAKSPAVPR